MFKLLCLLAFSFAVASATDDKKVKELKERTNQYLQTLAKLVFDGMGEMQKRIEMELKLAEESKNQLFIDCTNKAVDKAVSNFRVVIQTSEVTGLGLSLNDIFEQLKREQIDDETLSKLEAKLNSIQSSMEEAMTQFSAKVKEAGLAFAYDMRICTYVE